ncbi:MAG: hemolysin family protein [Deltaproteobacteria bacterium]
MSLEFVVGITAFFLLLQAFFAGAEIALVSCDKVRIKSLAESGSARARLVLQCFGEIEKFISTTLVGINLSLITNTIIMTFYIQDTYGSGGEFYTILILSPLIVIFGQVIPKAVFQRRSASAALWSIYPLWVASKIFSPILFVINIFMKRVLFRLIGRSENPFLTRDELLYAIEGNGAKAAGGGEYREKVIKRIFRFSETTIEEAMIPLIQVSAIGEAAHVGEAIRLIAQTGHSRIPTYSHRIDDITGVIHAFDLLGAKADEPVKNFSRPAFYVPESKPLDELLDEMKRGLGGLAVVVDEYGGAVGIISLEDIIEEVIGEIEDEYDKGLKLWRKTTEGEFLINPKIYIDNLSDELGISIPEGDYDTLGGFLLSETGSIPKAGERIEFGSLVFIITKASARAIEEVKLIAPK